MAREDWRDDERRARDWREAETERRLRSDRERRDFGQADYSRDYGYDPGSRTGYRRADDGRGPPDSERRYELDDEAASRRRAMEDPHYLDEPPPRQPRSWMDRAGAMFSPRPDQDAPRHRRGPSDRVLWTVIVERLEDERGLDLRDVEVIVEEAEVTLNGTVRRKDDRRRIEDVADIDGVRHVQNNLRVRDRGAWSLF